MVTVFREMALPHAHTREGSGGEGGKGEGWGGSTRTNKTRTSRPANAKLKGPLVKSRGRLARVVPENIPPLAW